MQVGLAAAVVRRGGGYPARTVLGLPGPHSLPLVPLLLRALRSSGFAESEGSGSCTGTQCHFRAAPRPNHCGRAGLHSWRSGWVRTATQHSAPRELLSTEGTGRSRQRDAGRAVGWSRGSSATGRGRERLSSPARPTLRPCASTQFPEHATARSVLHLLSHVPQAQLKRHLLRDTTPGPGLDVISHFSNLGLASLKTSWMGPTSAL